LNLPEHSSSPRRKDRRIYARKLRRKPGLRTATRPATAPAAGTSRRCSFRSLLIATVLVMPDGARFQVMVESLTGYPATIAKYMFPLPGSPSCCRRGSPHWRSCRGR
jgi:hypothetical protein